VTVDGETVATQKGYNCRGLHRENCFSGFYFDLTSCKTDTEHKLELKLGNFTAGQIDLGLYFDNVEPELTAELAV